MADNEIPPVNIQVNIGARTIGMQVEHADQVTHYTVAETNAERTEDAERTEADNVAETQAAELPASMARLSSTEANRGQSMTSQELIEVINYIENIGKLQSENDFAAIVDVTMKQSEIDQRIQHISNLVLSYVACLKAKKTYGVADIRGKITSIIRNHTQLTAPQVDSVSHDLRAQKKWLKSILFSSIAASLFESNGDPDGAVKGMQLCVRGIQISVEKMFEEDQSMKSVVQHHVIPLMRELKSTMENLPGVDAELKVVQLSECLCNIGYCEGLADIDDFQTYTEGVRLMGSIEDKQKYYVYGRLLNNIGWWYGRKSRYKEAAAKFSEALEAYRRATDWLNDSDKQRLIKLTENNLRSTKKS